MTITLLGTSHISPASVKKIRKEIDSEQYNLIAVELDRHRAPILLNEQHQRASFTRSVRMVGLAGAILATVGHWASNKLGMRIGVTPGKDMKTAMEEGMARNIPVALIDQPIHNTLRAFSKAFTIGEFFRFMWRGFRLTNIEIDLRKTPSQRTVNKLIGQLKHISPALYKVLVADRDGYMARQLIRIQEHNPNAEILAVVGAGHVPGIQKRLNHHAKHVKSSE